MSKVICPICGYPGIHPHYDQLNDICSSCGFQFGVTDDDRGYTYEQWRKKWIKNGMKWDKGRSKPPADWDPKRQLLNIGIKI